MGNRIFEMTWWNLQPITSLNLIIRYRKRKLKCMNHMKWISHITFDIICTNVMILKFLHLFNYYTVDSLFLKPQSRKGHASGCLQFTWWCHQMETFSALLAFCAGNSPVTGEFHAQRLVTRSFDVFFDLSLNKRLSKQSWGWWFETP